MTGFVLTSMTSTQPASWWLKHKQLWCCPVKAHMVVCHWSIYCGYGLMFFEHPFLGCLRPGYSQINTCFLSLHLSNTYQNISVLGYPGFWHVMVYHHPIKVAIFFEVPSRQTPTGPMIVRSFSAMYSLLCRLIVFNYLDLDGFGTWEFIPINLSFMISF